MPIKDRVLNDLNFAEVLNKARTLRKDLLDSFTREVDRDISTPTKQLHVEWKQVGTIERQCALLQQLLNEYDSDNLP